MLSLTISFEFKYPMTEEAIDAYSTYVQKTLTGYGIPGSRDLDEIDEEQSRPFIEAIMKFYKEKAVNFKFFWHPAPVFVGQEERGFIHKHRSMPDNQRIYVQTVVFLWRGTDDCTIR